MGSGSARRNPAVVDFSLKVLNVDYLLRWLSVGIYKFWGEDGGQVGTNIQIFIFLQLLITLLTLIHAVYRDYTFRKYIEGKRFSDDWRAHFKYLMRGFSLEKPYDMISTTFTVLIRVFFILTFSYMVVSSAFDMKKVDFMRQKDSVQNMHIAFVFTATLISYGFYVLYISTMSVPSLKKLSMPETIRMPDEAGNNTDDRRAKGPMIINLEKKPQSAETYEAVDLNDISIVKMEGDVKNLINRIDAYILESVMFGALTFSGFLTLIAIDPDTFRIEEIKTFGEGLINFILDFVVFNFKSNEQYRIFDIEYDILDTAQYAINRPEIMNLYELKDVTLQMEPVDSAVIVEIDRELEIMQNPQKTLINKDNLIPWIMFQTLVSSSFFLLVIASRLKFTQIIEKIDNAIRLARSYNNKEEEVFMLYLQFEESPKYKRRLEALSDRIEKQLIIAKDLVNEVLPIVYYMSLFRNLGVLVFLIIIITSLLFFDYRISGFFATLSVMVYLYKQLDDWYRKRKLEDIENKYREAETERIRRKKKRKLRDDLDDSYL